MGSICSSISCNNETEYVVLNEVRDPKLSPYKSSKDKYYKSFERKFNLLKYIQLSEFSMMFNDFNFSPTKPIKKKISQKNEIFEESLEKEEFMTFFKIKIVNNHLVYSVKDIDQQDQIFLEFLNNLYETIRRGMVSYASIYKKTSRDIKLDKKPKKYFLIALGMVYCQSDTWTKINFIYDTFCNQNNKIEASLYFKIFLFVLILISSFAGIICIQELSINYKEHLHALTEDDFMHVLEVYDVNDIVRIHSNFCQEFFGESGVLTYLEYCEKILNNGFDWILTSAGIRYMLEKKESNS
jgi:hypothetical protein